MSYAFFEKQQHRSQVAKTKIRNRSNHKAQSVAVKNP